MTLASTSPAIKLVVRTTPPSGFLTMFAKQVRMQATKVGIQNAKDLVARARKVILYQEFNWFPLDPDYEQSKYENGLDTRIYIATRDYVDHGIGWYERNGCVYAGALEGTHIPSGLTYRQLARIHEFGTWTIPARPLWRPLLSMMMREGADFRKRYYRAVRAAVIRKQAVVKTIVARRP